MTARELVHHFAESPVLFRAGENELFGVLTEPRGVPSRGVGVVLSAGGAYIAAPNRNRLSVRLARRLAPAGFHVVRFDYRGVGESTGSIAGYWLDRPFVEDLEGAVRVLAEAGARDVVLVGSCFGARTILAMADRVKPLIGAVLISTPVRDFQMGDNLPSRYAEEMTLPQMVRKALRPRVLLNLVAPRTREAYLRSRRLYIRTAALKAQAILDKFQGRGLSRRKEQQDGVSAAFLSGFRRLVERRVPVLMLYGRAEGFYEEFERVRQRQLGDLLAAHPGTVTIETIEGVVHGFTSIDVQEAVAERTEAWVRLLRVRTQPVDDA